MGRFVFRLPDIGEGIAEAELIAWHVRPGDAIAEDAPMVELMTDKATVEIPSPRAGTVVSMKGAPGERIPVGSELIVLEVEEKPQPALAQSRPAAAMGEASPARNVGVDGHEARAPVATLPASAARVLAAPAVRQRARALGIDLHGIAGSGPEGRVTHADLDAHLRDGAALPTPLRTEVEDLRLTGLRRRIAERLEESWRRIPHFSYVETIDVGALEDLRADLNARHPGRPHLTLLPFLLRALVGAIRRVPQVNAQYDDAAGILRRHAALHAGIAVQTPGGLMVPVLRHAEALDLWQAAAGIARLAAAAREGHAGREELSGSTLTITSLGPLGGIVSTPLINPPEVAIVGVNRIVEQPVVQGGGIVARRMMNLSCSFDHRVIDGWDAATFVQEVKARLEQPAALFME
ncbi:Lipoamide acyltransferase component of branched-chain alpha-keto acid dehydrogenase complex [Rhodovastum atsumiense]|uniref:Dihydrolipoamide acetyltransferase component of pyruvate dehydrogenase complex n=1 Tax=Rhodovastum atsumiense TaxID=504468 RepID=A0A5M6IR25_9PROT|nr:dihydrolipoamide acetyltransferase family protein [Rhodovastum atsumiense]KAA5610736.1 2-oxo acid dehydrogenase subunit E2 [Rhodovastum atsumiense]CAH2604363.1 Lipoamide acyltransferase component of branched-chain alpha-keto acid dehydrogenase complex [Rhodovastum atsumiense]